MRLRAGQPVGDTRKRFAAVALDGVFRVPAVAPLLIKLIKARNDAKAADLGIGIVSMLGFSTTCKALQVRALCTRTCTFLISLNQRIVSTLSK